MVKVTIAAHKLPEGALKPIDKGFEVDGTKLEYGKYYWFEIEGVKWVVKRNRDETVDMGHVATWDRFISWIKNKLRL